MKRLYTRWFFLLLLLVPFGQKASAGDADPTATALFPKYFGETNDVGIEQLTIYELLGSTSLHVLPSENDRVHSRLERKKKTKFLLRNCCFSHHIRKGYSRPYNFAYQPSNDPDHAPVPDEAWHARPGYYLFLFRLSPF